MPVYKPKGSPHFHYAFSLNGLRFRKSTKTANRREAEKVEERAREKALLGGTGREPITVSAALARYYAEHAKFQASADDDWRMMERLKAAFGDTLFSALSDDDVATYVARRRAEPIRIGRKRKPGKRLVSNATVNREVELLRRVARKAKRAWKRDVADIEWSLHLLPEPKERVREATPEEQAKILKAFRPDMAPLAEWAGLTGARFAAGASLTWAQVDGDGTTRIRLKGGAEHTIPGTTDLKILYARQRGKHSIYVFPYLCQKSNGKRRKGHWYPWSRDGWRKAWGEALKASGVKDFRWHDWRHTAGSRITRASGIHVAQKLLGHTDIATTKRYAHVNQEDVKRAMEESSRQVSAKLVDSSDTKAVGNQ